ncbi:MAG: hypothetical protein HY918_03340 [Candidatus Doudnabacteria bacterium]|nr:hypothetical protein [Candidatus Doudnabacteria bacterium]
MQEHVEKICERLDVLIALLLDLQDSINQSHKKPTALSIKMMKLRQLGLENIAIAKIFAKTPAEVAKLIYETKRKKK